MSIAFARISYHSRSQGHSAVAGAAYRAGEKLFDKRTGEQHNFQNRSDVLYSNILLPEDASEHFRDRETLWNAVEAAETRKNSQVAKDIILALPRELDLAQQIDLTRHFAEHHFVQHGIVADVAIHDHGDGNPHAHLYVTTRRLKGDRFDKYKARDLEPDVARGRVVDPQYWGEQWRDCQNDFFKAHDLGFTVDANHIVSMRHEGRIRGDEVHYLKEENKLRREASVEIALNDPESVLNLLGTQHAVFSERDIALLLNKNTETKEDFETALLRLKAHKDLILLGPGDDGRDRYTTQANYQRETRMADQAYALSRHQAHPVARALVTQASQAGELNAEQADALSYLAKSGDLCAVVGRAGTGKSYMMRAARQMWESAGYRVQGMAVSGIATKGLEAESGIASRTIYSFRQALNRGQLVLTANDILVMDEAGMTDLTDLAAIIEAVIAAGAKLVLVGDHSQLQPVGPGAPFRAIIEQTGFSALNHIQRQVDEADRVASTLLAQGDVAQALSHYAAKEQVHLVDSDPDEEDGGEGGGDTGSGATLSRLVVDWAAELTADNLHERLILAHRNEDVAALNNVAREAMQAKGLLGKRSHRVKGQHGTMKVSVGERLLFLKNDRQLGVSNGEFATILSIDGSLLTVQPNKPDSPPVTFSTQDYSAFDYGYAATVHKSQGVTVNHTFVYVAGRSWDRFLTYVAMTRHRLSLNVYAAKAQFKDIDVLGKLLSRAALKDSVLDWPVSFAIRRGFDPESVLGRFIDRVLGIKQALHDKWLFVTNYVAYRARKDHRALLQARGTQRELARKVAFFVDLRNGLGAQAAQMREDLSPDEKFYKHDDYPGWYKQTLLRNRLAFELKQDYPVFEKALSLNRISDEVLDRYVDAHERLLRLEQYLKHKAQGQTLQCYRLAEKLHEARSRSFSQLIYLSEKHGFDVDEMSRAIRQDAKAYKRLHYLTQLLPQERRDFRVVDEYVKAKKAVNMSIAQAYDVGGFDTLSEAEVARLTQQKTTCDALADKIKQAPLRYAPGVHFYELANDKLVAESERHQSRELVGHLTDSTLTHRQRDALAYNLLSDSRYYPMMVEQGVDWKALRAQSQTHQHRDALLCLSKDERRAYRGVIRYQQARIDAGTAWSALFEDKNNGVDIPNARWKFAIALSHTRDRLAYDIAVNSDACMPFVTPTRLKLADIEKHAARYRDKLETLEKQRAQKATRQRSRGQRLPPTPLPQQRQASVRPHLEYRAVNDALVAMGDDFYQRVLGDAQQRTGSQLRYGKKGSLSVSLNGPHAGGWHSFETDEGGGPLQLLMNSVYGWGLSYPEALKEGASMAGLSATPSTYNPPPKAAVQKPDAPVVDNTDKIARARYYYDSAVPIAGTVGERYLREHRKLSGDLSAFRFHPKIRDDNYDKAGNQITSYHPGLVVGAQNRQGEIVAVQTILLSPETANKVDKDSVGVVKRTRASVKGNAVLIHRGTSSQVVIAEGPETAASLIEAAPEASIYVTLGNIKNAAALGWLADKHNTDTFYFAADNDGPSGKSLSLLKDVARQLQDEHQITSRISMPTLPNQDKCDFNDVLQVQGLKGLKKQWSNHQPIMLLKQEKQVLISKDDIHHRLHAGVDEWVRLGSLNNSVIKELLEDKAVLDKETRPEAIDIYTRSYEQSVETICRHEKLFLQVEAVAPRLAKNFREMTRPPKPVKIDWLSDTFKKEFDNLRQSKDCEIQYMVDFYDILRNPKNEYQIEASTRQLESLAMDVAKSKHKSEELKRLAPKLTTQVLAFEKVRSKEINIGRSL